MKEELTGFKDLEHELVIKNPDVLSWFSHNLDSLLTYIYSRRFLARSLEEQEEIIQGLTQEFHERGKNVRNWEFDDSFEMFLKVILQQSKLSFITYDRDFSLDYKEAEMSGVAILDQLAQRFYLIVPEPIIDGKEKVTGWHLRYNITILEPDHAEDGIIEYMYHDYSPDKKKKLKLYLDRLRSKLDLNGDDEYLTSLTKRIEENIKIFPKSGQPIRHDGIEIPENYESYKKYMLINFALAYSEFTLMDRRIKISSKELENLVNSSLATEALKVELVVAKDAHRRSNMISGDTRTHTVRRHKATEYFGFFSV